MTVKWAGLSLAVLLAVPTGALAAKHHHTHATPDVSAAAAIDLFPTANPERAAPAKSILLASSAVADMIPTPNPERAIATVTAAAVNLAPTPNPIQAVELTDAVETPADTAGPSVQWPLQKLSCVPYARLRSGLAIFGDAKLWWQKARDMYAQLAQPVADAVMVFSGSARLSHGHVAVVTQIISPREIKVDHANWQNKGEIDLNMPVLDVSANNDWSQVRVWNVQTNSFGSHIYAISGFITRDRATGLAP